VAAAARGGVPLLIGRAGAAPDLQAGAVCGVVVPHVQALVCARVDDVVVRGDHPLLVGAAGAVPQLDRRAVGGAAVDDVETLAERPQGAVTRVGPELRSGAVAVVELYGGAVGTVRSGHVDALAGESGDPAVGGVSGQHG